MRYCFVTYGPWARNAGHIRPHKLGSALSDLGVDVSYIVDDYEYNRTSLPELSGQVAFVEDPKGARQVLNRRRVLRGLAPDWLHVCNPHAKTLAAVSGTRRPKILGEWDEPPVMRGFTQPRRALEGGLDVWLRRRADRVVVCTKYLERLFREQYGISAVYLPHATYLEAYPDGPSPFAEPTAVYLGTFLPNWDHAILFEALGLLADRGVQPRVEFVGDGGEMDRWRAYVSDKQLGNVTMPGWLDGLELWRRLRHAHVNLFPIRNTQLNRARCPSKIFAYAQAHRPVITNRVGEVEEFFADRATYIECTPEAFASAIEDAMAGPRQNDVDFAVERRNYRDMATRLLEALEPGATG